ncbi:MAG: protoporphyrinogen oxidase, partial [Micromonosporaceae bacterium]
GLVVDGELRALPAGSLLGIPTQAGPIGSSLGEDAALAVTAEPQLPGTPLTEDVSVGELTRRRLGDAIVDCLVDPLLGGVYAGRADQLSLQATMPAVAAELTHTPSLVRAAEAALEAARRGPGAAAPARGPSDDGERPTVGRLPASAVFGTVRGGMGALPDAVLRASGAELRLRLPVREVLRSGHGFRVIAGPVPAPTLLDADAVIIAAPAAKAAPMLSELAPMASYELAQIAYASLAIVTLAYQAGALPPGSGMLVPATAGRRVKALTYSSQKWAHLAGEHVIVRASIGRHGDEQALHRDDAELVELAARDAAELTSLPGGVGGRAGVIGAPVAARVSRWGGALPQYAVGHTDRVRRIFDQVATVPGLAVCGAAYQGVGVPACIRSGQQAAASVLASLREPGRRGGAGGGSGSLGESES